MIVRSMPTGFQGDAGFCRRRTPVAPPPPSSAKSSGPAPKSPQPPPNRAPLPAPSSRPAPPDRSACPDSAKDAGLFVPSPRPSRARRSTQIRPIPEPERGTDKISPGHLSTVKNLSRPPVRGEGQLRAIAGAGARNRPRPLWLDFEWHAEDAFPGSGLEALHLRIVAEAKSDGQFRWQGVVVLPVDRFLVNAARIVLALFHFWHQRDVNGQ